MQITVAENAGFCFGVRNAIETAVNNADGGIIYTIGDIIHNKRVVENLREKGVISIDDLSFLKKGDKVVIRAHGVPPETEKFLRDIGCLIFDATCTFVKRIQKITEEYSKKGYKIIIIGDKNHPEIISICGYSQNNYQIIDNVDEIIDDSSDKYAIVCQTTFSDIKYKNIVQNIQNNVAFRNKTVVFFDTICYTTKARQEEARILARKNDCILVIGDKKSANANRLYQISLSENENTFFIQKVSDTMSVPITKFTTMALVAAASTPNELIEEVFSSMSETQNNEVLEKVAENTATEAVAEEANTASLEAEEKVAPIAEEAKESELTMDAIMASDKSAGFTTYREGKRITAKILNADENGIFVEIGGKKDGFIDKTEVNIDGSYNPADYKKGDTIEAIIINKKGDSTYVTLSKREVDIVKKNDEEALAMLESTEFTLEPPLKIVKNKEGNPVGLEGRLGAFTVFIPGSQIRVGRVNNLEDYLDKKLRLRMLQKNGRRITASQRVILEEEKALKEDNFWAEIIPGSVVKGKVKRFASFGAFVSVKGYDCLAHVSDLSWKKKNVDPAEILEINNTYDFVVLKADRETGKISLGYKQLQKKPYEIAAEKYPVGSVIKGTIARIHPFGAFVEIEDGIDGLIHVSQISHKYVKEATELLHEGQEVEAKIISFEGNRITLSMKELEPAPEEKPVSTKVVDEEVVAEQSATDSKPKAPRPRKKIEYNPDKGEERRNNRRDDRNSDEPHEWVSDSGNATLADLLKGLDLKFDDVEEENK